MCDVPGEAIVVHAAGCIRLPEREPLATLLPLDLILAVLSALPFLPRGKGAAILILGGMALLGFSLCWSMLALRSVRATARGLSHARASTTTASEQPSFAAALRPEAPWLWTLLATAVRAGLGDPHIVQAEPLRQILRLDNCRGCRGRRGASGCERERASLERVLAALSPDAEVTEIACNTDRKGACTYELRTGANAR